MPVTGAFPYDVANLLGGAARVLFADTTEPIPTKLNDVIALESPYAAQTGWTDFGATKEGASYSREINTEGYEIQQTPGLVLEEITEVNRQLEVSVAEVKPEHLQILEEAAATGSVAAVAGTNTAQTTVPFGSFRDVTHRRVAFVGQRNRQSGVVVEDDATERGPFVALVLYNVAIAADTSQVDWEKGDLVELPLTFSAFPEDGEESGEEYGLWIVEAAGDISP